MAKKLRCYLGLHRWVTMVASDGERYSKCKDCDKSGPIPSPSMFAMRYRDR